MDKPHTLEYKNFWLFYKNLYERLFNMIDLIIDENSYDIVKVKEVVLDFMDSYSYYLIKKKLIQKTDEDLEKNNIIKLLSDFTEFTDTLNKYPSKEYNKILIDYKLQGNNLLKLSANNYKALLKEYYAFFDDVLIIIKNFIDIASTNGFLPNIRSKKSLKSIGYANYDLFFTNLEDLKIKMSTITTKINLRNIFKNRRCVYSILVVFSPYFTRPEIYSELIGKLDFKFLEDDEVIKKIRQSSSYKELYQIPEQLKEELEEKILNDLKNNIALIKRYISYEFGERDMSPMIKKKYGYDPTDT